MTTCFLRCLTSKSRNSAPGLRCPLIRGHCNPVRHFANLNRGAKITGKVPPSICFCAPVALFGRRRRFVLARRSLRLAAAVNLLLRAARFVWAPASFVSGRLVASFGRRRQFVSAGRSLCFGAKRRLFESFKSPYSSACMFCLGSH